MQRLQTDMAAYTWTTRHSLAVATPALTIGTMWVADVGARAVRGGNSGEIAVYLAGLTSR